MKSIKNYIVEAFKINKNIKLKKIEHKYFPESKKELKEIIREHFDQNIYDLNDVDVSKITDMRFLFNANINPFLREAVKKMDISLWDVSNVTTMSHMFILSNFNGDISRWNVSNVKDMSSMFSESEFNGDISKWDVSNVEDMSFMFNNSKFDGKNGDISNWDVSKVLNMSSMFHKTNIDKNFLSQIKSWNIKKCTGFCNMFSLTPFFRDKYTIDEISKLWNYPFNYN